MFFLNFEIQLTWRFNRYVDCWFNWMSVTYTVYKKNEIGQPKKRKLKSRTFNTARPASKGTTTLMEGNLFLTASWSSRDSENPPTITIASHPLTSFSSLDTWFTKLSTGFLNSSFTKLTSRRNLSPIENTDIQEYSVLYTVVFTQSTCLNICKSVHDQILLSRYRG